MLRHNPKSRNVIAPVFTPFNECGMTLNLDIIPQYAKYLEDSKIDGVLVNGTSGEGTSLSVSERKQLAEAWSKAVQSTNLRLMIQVGGAPLPDVLQLAKHAEQIKADSILCLPELYFKPAGPTELIEYLKLVGVAAPHTPLFYYHIPMFTHVKIHMGQFLESIGNAVPSLAGIKFTSTNLEEAAQASRADLGRYEIFLGSDQIMTAAWSLGINSFIATSVNIFPDLATEICTSLEQRSNLRAMDLQEKLSQAVRAISKYGNWVVTMKTAMNLKSHIKPGPVRAPLKSLSSDCIASMQKDLESLDIKI